jgi:hypothetical protein
MSKRKKASVTRAMLDLWRPPPQAGDPIGCLATTYTFSPGLFDEQCLARFLEIDSEPDREDLAFLLERESRLGGVYAGVLVDHTQAGVEHSLRWDVLPVRIRAGKQHSKLNLLAWSRHVRITVASANLTEPGYRTNYEVAAAVDLTPDEANTDILAEAVSFLRSLLLLVPGASESPPQVARAEGFLRLVERQVQRWKPIHRGGTVRQQLVFTIPRTGVDHPERSSLEEAIQACRRRGGAPAKAWIASPFFDAEAEASRVTASLCKHMARDGRRDLRFCVPAIEDDGFNVPRLAAPKALFKTPPRYQGTVAVDLLPTMDGDKNRRPWHAKMLALVSDSYSALMNGSSNFTCAGMGVAEYRNAEANLLTIVDRANNGRKIGQLEAVWPEMERVSDPQSAEWLGASAIHDEEEQAAAKPLPAGFLLATYRAGDERWIVLRIDPAHLPEEWQVHACGRYEQELLSAPGWRERGCPSTMEIAWAPVQPPEKVLVQWGDYEAFLPLNVEDSRKLPPPAKLEEMSADDMLGILAAADPSAAFRAWARRQHSTDQFDSDLDSATPIDLDPLRRHDPNATFLHRVRRRARVLAQLRSNLQRPVWGRQALEWRLRGLVGVEPLADRLLKEFTDADGGADEKLLTLADFLIVLREVDYQPTSGSLPKTEFEEIFKPFLVDLANKLRGKVSERHEQLSNELTNFWGRVVARCQE